MKPAFFLLQKDQSTNYKAYLFRFYHPAPNFRSYYKAIEKKNTKKQNGRAHCTHCSIIVSSTYAVLELNIVKVQVKLIFVLQNFQL